MNEKMYARLNAYLNEIFKYLEVENEFLLRNIEEIAKMNDTFLKFLKNKPLENKTIENHLTCEEILFLTREIIESIDPNYLEDFDSLVASGTLDFSFEQEYEYSYFRHIEENHQVHNVVNINREFNYHDVVVFVHEFIHYISGKEKWGKSYELFTEFLAIYFELYATECLLNKGISSEEIDYNHRLKITGGHASTLCRYEIVLLAYEKFGFIDTNTHQLLSKYFINISEKQFELECYNLYKNLKRIDKKDTEDKENRGQGSKLSEPFIAQNYRYIFGTLLAFYARTYANMDDIVYLNNHINEMDEKSVTEICNSIGINIRLTSEIEEIDWQTQMEVQKMNKEFLTKTFASIEDYLKKYNTNIKR